MKKDCNCLFLLALAMMTLDVSEGRPRHLNFTVSSRYLKGTQWVTRSSVYNGYEATLTCISNDTRQTSLGIRRQDEPNFISTSPSKQVLYQIDSTQCNDTGTYVCEDDRGHNLTLDFVVHNCKPQPCDGENKTRIIYAAVNETKTFSFCIIAEPGISDTALIDDVQIFNNKKEMHNASYWRWSYKKEKSNVYTVNVTLSVVNFRNYTFTATSEQSEEQKLTYTIVFKRAQMPDCPTEIRADKIGKDYVTLSWKPGWDGGATQSFTIYYKKGERERQQLRDNIYESSVNVTGLIEATNYTFQLLPKNKYYEHTKCDENLVSALTDTDASSTPLAKTRSAEDTYHVIIPVVSIVILLIVAAVVACVAVNLKLKKFHIRRWTSANANNSNLQYLHRDVKTGISENGGKKRLMATDNCYVAGRNGNESGHHVSEEGLVYVTVDHEAKKKKILGGRTKQQAEKVEYSTLDIVKTEKLKTNKLNNKNTSRKPEEKLYANM